MTAPTDDDPATTAAAGASPDAGEAAVLEARVPGPELLAALSIDPALVVGEVAEAGMRAGFALECHATWLRLRWLLEACRARAGTTERILDDPHAAQVAAASLSSSATMAAMRLELAHGVCERLPALGEEMARGRLEERKAWHFVSVLRDLDDETAREVVDRLLGRAASTPHQKLRDLIEAKAGELDPAWDEVRKAAALARARVLARLRSSGAGEISGLDLPWEPAKEAYDHVVAVADAVRKDLAGRGITLGEGIVQAHVFVRLLGRGHLGADDPDIVARLADELAAQPHGDDLTDPDDQGPDDGGPDDDPDDDPDGGPDPGDGGPGPGPGGGPGPEGGNSGPGDDGPADDGPADDGPADSGAADSGPVDDDDPASENGLGPDLDSLDGDGPSGREPSDDGSSCSGALFDLPTGSGAAAGAGRRLAFRRRVAVRLGLATLLGLDRAPGHMPGWGTVTAPTARNLAGHRRAATWRLLLYNTLGLLEHSLLIHPPGGTGDLDPDDPHRRQTVELVASTDLLETLDAENCLHPDLVAGARAALAAARARPDKHPATTTADAHRRHPGTVLDAWVRGRDRTCRFPGCDEPAHAADLDHTRAVTDDGLTFAENLGALCRHHHRLKHHTRSGWTLAQPTAGTFVWTAPTGATYVIEQDPVQPPGPPRNTSIRPHLGLLHAQGEYEPRPWTPRRDRHGRISDAARETAVLIDRHERKHRWQPPNPFDDDPPF